MQDVPSGAKALFISRVRTASLSIAWIILCSWMSSASSAEDFVQTHPTEIQKMVAASVGIENGFNTVFEEFARKLRSAPDPRAADLVAEGKLNTDCYFYVHAKFYSKFRSLLDNIDTSAFTGFDYRKSRSDKSVLRDPKKIAYETKYVLSGFEFRKDFEPPLEEFVVRYAARPDVETACSHYLDVTGMKS